MENLNQKITVIAKKAWHSLTLWFNGLIAFLVAAPEIVATVTGDPSYNIIGNLLDTKGKSLTFIVVVVVINYLLRKYKTSSPIQK